MYYFNCSCVTLHSSDNFCCAGEAAVGGGTYFFVFEIKCSYVLQSFDSPTLNPCLQAKLQWEEVPMPTLTSRTCPWILRTGHSKGLATGAFEVSNFGPSSSVYIYYGSCV